MSTNSVTMNQVRLARSIRAAADEAWEMGLTEVAATLHTTAREVEDVIPTSLREYITAQEWEQREADMYDRLMTMTGGQAEFPENFE